MKANEAPEKLYIALNELTESGRTFVLDHRVDHPTCTEYTRTDAFIEKAWDWVEDNILSSNQQDKSRLYCEQFRKYMKGE